MKQELERLRIERAGRHLFTLYPDTGQLRRELYPKHMEFFVAGATHQERAFIGGNRTGKTTCTCYETTCHLIGWYPEWWEGWRFDHPVVWWVAGEDAKAMRESIEPVLVGPPSSRGTGMIPPDDIVRLVPRQGVPDAVDSVIVKHKKGTSRLVFKTYDQGRESYQGAKIDGLTLDEEPPMPIYTEGLTRTMSTVPGVPNGRVLAGFTPLKGISGTVLSFLPGGAMPSTETERQKAWGW